MFSARADATTLRSYCRPLHDDYLETWPQVVERSTYQHHLKLWEDAGGTPDLSELAELRELGLQRKSMVAGRTLWLGGTEYAYSRAASQFNCAATRYFTVYDAVDAAWLLLNGCGVGAKPQVGVLHGYTRPIPELEVVPSERSKDYRGREDNLESLDGGVWTIAVGDSAQAWAKALGKMLNPKVRHADKLCLDFSEVRGPGGRLKGYGWICNGYKPLADALCVVHSILNEKAGELLDELDIGDLHNLMGQILSSRRAAEILHMDSWNPRLQEFMRCKERYWEVGKDYRRQSNNSVLYWSEPSRSELASLLELAFANGDPAPINAAASVRKAPWFQYFNPCGEIFLGAFCNLVTNALPRFRRDFSSLCRAVYLIARANYRQTCVDLQDGVLQPVWHQCNEALRLCGVSLTGIEQAAKLTDYQIRRLRCEATHGAYSMADELDMPRPKAVTCLKPEGSGSKTADCTEGLKRPLGRYIFNWIAFSQHDPLVERHAAAGYRVIPHPQDSNNVLVRFPVDNTGVDFGAGGIYNVEPAVEQLDRYLRWNTLWADHNVSFTVDFDREEIPAIAEWLDVNWDRGYIGAAFLRRSDPRVTAKDLGHPYLPQEVRTEEDFREYASKLRPVDYTGIQGVYDMADEGCASGVCPAR